MASGHSGPRSRRDRRACRAPPSARAASRPPTGRRSRARSGTAPCRRSAPRPAGRRGRRSRLAVSAESLWPGVRMPIRLSGSAPDSDTHSPDAGRRRISRKQSDRVGQRELLAGEAGDEPAAANFAARLQPAIDAQQIAPRRQPSGLLRRAGARRPRRSGRAACAPHVRPRRRELVAAVRLRARAMDQRPAAAALDVEAQHAPAPPRAGERLALVRRHQQRAQAAEAVGGREPERHQFAERLLELRAQQARGLDELVEEQRAAARSRQSSTACARPLDRSRAARTARAPSRAARGDARSARSASRRPATHGAAARRWRRPAASDAPRTCARPGIGRRARQAHSP